MTAEKTSDERPAENPEVGFGKGGRRTGTSADMLPDVDGLGRDAPPLWRRIATERWGEGRFGLVMGGVILALGIALTAFQLWIALRSGLDARQQRLIHRLHGQHYRHKSEHGCENHPALSHMSASSLRKRARCGWWQDVCDCRIPRSVQCLPY